MCDTCGAPVHAWLVHDDAGLVVAAGDLRRIYLGPQLAAAWRSLGGGLTAST